MKTVLELLNESINLSEATKNFKSTGGVTPKISTKYEVGAILYDTWGYDQTNYDFYCIIKTSGEQITIQKMTVNQDNGSDMTSKVTPIAIDPNAKPIRKKLRKDSEGNPSGFSLRDYAGGGWVRLWNGVTKTASHYA